MTYFKSFTLYLSIAITCSCTSGKRQSDPVKYGQETARFNAYLQACFSMSLPADSNTFVLLSSSGCSGCVKSFLHTLTRAAGNPKVHYIVPDKLLNKENLDASLLNNAVMIDRENRVDRLPYHKGNIAIIESAGGVIYNLYKLEPYQTDSMLMLLNK